jgi:hypothetical protein
MIHFPAQIMFTGYEMRDVGELRVLVASTAIGALILGRRRVGVSRYEGRGATATTLIAMESLLRGTTPAEIFDSDVRMIHLSNLMTWGVRFAIRLGNIMDANSFLTRCQTILHDAGVTHLHHACFRQLAMVDRPAPGPRPQGDLPHYLFFITMHSSLYINGSFFCFPLGIVEMEWAICEQEVIHIHAVARTIHPVCPSALCARIPPVFRASCEALEKEPAASLEYIRRQSRRTEVFVAPYERRLLSGLHNPLGPYITRGIWAAPRRAGSSAVEEGCPLELARGITGGDFLALAAATPRPRPGRCRVFSMMSIVYEEFRRGMVTSYGAGATALICQVCMNDNLAHISRPIVIICSPDPMRLFGILDARMQSGYPHIHNAIAIIDPGDWENFAIVRGYTHVVPVSDMRHIRFAVDACTSSY